ncbi:Two component regulator three Y domain-containing protein [Chryseobacterium sp. T16E-39]|nr:Two component regulator three Y domain-containing protein [Chryseobacterium sp. T16E-39]
MSSSIFSKVMDNQLTTNNDFNPYYVELIHRCFLFLFSLFFFYSLFYLFFLGDTVVSIIFVFLTLFFASLMNFRKTISRSHRILKPLAIVVFVLLTFIIDFFYVYTWKSTGVEYFYFSLLFAVPFYFRYREDYYFILGLVIFIVFSFVGCQYFEISFLPKSRFIKSSDFELLRSINIIFTLIICLMEMKFLYRKDRLIYGLINDQKAKDCTIEDLVKVNNDLMKNKINDLTEEDIAEILALAESGSSVFLEKFHAHFPDFIPNVLSINSSLIASELNICALMRLNFDTKKIALCTNSSVRAIESRKYRIRKKLDIPSDMNINYFIFKV